METDRARTLSQELLQEIVRRIVEAVAPEKIILFGSAARGEMGPDSDLDLLIVKECERPREVARLIRRTLIGIGIPVDVLVVTPKHLQKHKDTIGYIYRPALREGKVVYAA
ncbi:MAG: nucleotidyltransferase domain-containing protein [Candidatus Rokubacteria bacterium]|nr:nucleotidyltransferase domain-containing protein [Candidatus Rokubacteria bacterium]